MVAKGNLLIVSGLLGSELTVQTHAFGVVPDTPLWLNYALMASGAYIGLTLDDTGLHNFYPTVGDLGPGGPLPAYYRETINYFVQAGYNVFAANLDWRQQVELDAQRVVTLLQEIGSESPCNVLCHSRGGLVIRRALGLLESAGQLGLIGRIAGFGVPHSGSFEATKALAGWGVPITDVLAILDRNPVTAQYLYTSPSVLNMFRSWPSLYALQPAPGASWPNAGDTTTIYTPAAWAEFMPAIDVAWLGAAVASWQSLPPVPSGTQWLDVVGTTWPTPQGLSHQAIPTDAQGLTFTGSGDGVVVVQSARLGIGPQIVAPTQHSFLTADGRIFPYVDQWFQGLLSEDIIIPLPQLGSM